MNETKAAVSTVPKKETKTETIYTGVYHGAAGRSLSVYQ